MGTVLETFGKWKSFLAERVQQAKQAGMTEETINNIAFQIGEFLDKQVDPKNVEEQLLKELWDVGDVEERKVLAGLMVKFVEQK